MSHCNVVYKISCEDCNASYVGQTKRKLQTRVKEHRNDINKKFGSPSVISTHRLESGHEFRWGHVVILDEESSYKRRLVSEMVNIKRQVKPLNLQSDTQFLSEEYLTVLVSLTSALGCDLLFSYFVLSTT
ncbi:hypothetical protein X777_14399 [Ooceraea biroi]|uniref:GIY-YIG domain-containing protein n=1 Tax=Ooceraea biroi TaxID=2015173 RepID=A0A026VWI3_OOCBI|nr:hypothetical protein X777_14399 [Ooceraea biroi]